jgi:predicted nucleic acid-binding protein
MAFWDTSALLKLYVREPDSERFSQMMRTSADYPSISQLTLAEMYRAFWAKAFARVISKQRAETTYREFRADAEAAVFEVIPFGGDVQQEFERVVAICYRARPAVPIRTLDGLLLASALIARTRELVSTDSRMRTAGALLGLRVLPDRLR